MRHFLYSLFFISTLAVGQDVAQLRAELNEASSDTARVHLLSELSEAYVGLDSAKVFAYEQKTLAMLPRLDDLYKVGQAYYLLGKIRYRYYHVEKAKTYFSLAKAQFEQLLATDSSENYQRWWVKCVFNYSVMLGEQGLADLEIKNYMLVDKIAKQIAYTEMLAFTCSNLAVRFNNLEQYDKAYYYFTKGFAFYEQIDVPSQFIDHQLVFAACLYMMDSLDRMGAVLDKVKYALDTVPQATERPLYHLVNGKYLVGREAYHLALAQYDTAYYLVKKNEMSGYLKEVLRDYVDLHLQWGNYQKAKHYLTLYTEEAKKYSGARNQLLVLDAWARYEIKTQDYEQAVTYLQKYVATKDSLENAITERQLNELEIAYQTEQKEREILILERQNYQAGLALEKEQFRSYLHVFIFSFMLVLLVSGGCILFRKKQHEAEKREQERKIQVQELQHQQQTQVLSALIEGQEKERQRLASDLHDGLAGRLSGISFNLATFTQEAHRKPEACDMRNILAHMNSALAELRCIARNLTPKTLSEKGLQVALEDYCSSLKGIGSNIVLQFYDTEETLEEQVNLTLYRIIQELIHNAVKYAQASEILVQYIREDHAINITVEDDGVGFDLHRLPSGSSMGLTNVRTRVNYLNGNIEIQSFPGRGTTVWIQVSV